MQYIMITHWKGHWDGLPNGETVYTDTMFRSRMDRSKLVEDTQTIFIKIDEKTKKPEKAWIGTVCSFRPQEGKIRFKVNLEKKIPCPKKYYDSPEGWYAVEEGTCEVKKDQQTFGKLYPPFLEILKSTDDWKEFEFYSHWLIRLAGVHDIYRFEEQKGKADGFFKFNNLAVMHDCTLDKNFQIRKKDQIINFCNQLKSGKIEDEIIDISHCRKQVWIITRGEARIVKKIDEVVVREVPFDDIIEFYLKQFEDNLNENALSDMLTKAD